MRLGLTTLRAWPTLLIPAVFVLVACGSPAGTPGGLSASRVSPDSDAIRVATTTTVFADILSAVGGRRAAVRSIIPSGVGPEDYEPKPDDARSLADAQLIVSNGVGLDDFLDRLLTAGGGGSTPQLVLGDGIPAINVDALPNPHFWLDPSIVKTDY